MKKLNIDLIVGLFIVVGFMAFVYLSLQLGEFSPFSIQENYRVKAEFGNISGLKRGAVVELAGVTIGKVANIELDERDRAVIIMYIDKSVKITEDAIASIRTQGIIGDKYVRISQGGAEEMIGDGGIITETESAIDIEELVSKYIFGKV